MVMIYKVDYDDSLSHTFWVNQADFSNSEARAEIETVATHYARVPHFMRSLLTVFKINGGDGDRVIDEDSVMMHKNQID